MISKYLHHIAAIAIFLLLIGLGAYMSDGMAHALLLPYAKLAELYFGASHEYIADVGFVEVGNRYILGRDCLGVNFSALFYLVTTVPFLNKLDGLRRTLWVALCLPVAVIVGFIVNAIRVLGSIPFATYDRFTLTHAATGITLYLVILTASYAVLKKSFERKNTR